MSEQTTEAGAARTTLVGHDSEATAYVVADYPYGFRLRCQMRYWIETTKHGQRLVSQTSNPKRGGWNKPKKGVYHTLAVMTLDEEGHVQISVLQSFASSEPVIRAFAERHAAALDTDHAREAIKVMLACARASERVTVTVRVVAAGDPPGQTREEQAAIMSAAVRGELRALASEAS